MSPANPFSRQCVIAGCSAPVARGGRCAAHGRQADQTRGLTSDRHHKALYASARWRQTRAAVLAGSPLCSCDECRQTGATRVTSVVHHRRAHHGMIDILTHTLLTVLDGGGRDLLGEGQSAEMDELLGGAGVRAKEYRELAAEAKRLFRLAVDESGEQV